MKQANKPATNQATLQRRKLLGAAGTTGALVAAATLLAARQDAADAGAAAAKKTAPAPGEGYQETAHVLHYYQTTKV
ncbi:MAG: formate dehydrogenase [Burkholderiales bacterium]|jgi:secreted PhoX family phosphatase